MSGEEMVEVKGKTYHVRDKLKYIGGVWDPARKVWMVPKSQSMVAELIVNNASEPPMEWEKGAED